MQAYVQTGNAKDPSDNNGRPDLSVFSVQTIPLPGPPPPGHVTLRVRAAALNPVDYKRAVYFTDAAPCIIGYDVSGIVDTVASDVTNVQKGDRVFGEIVAETLANKPAYNGACAEYVHVPARLLAPIPENTTFEQAAAVPLVAMTALQVFRVCKLAEGERVFIGAGAGGVGLHALQVAKSVFKVAEVATSASPAKEAVVKEYGADVVVNYREKDVGAVLAGWADVAIDTMGDFETIRRVGKSAADGGRVSSIVGSDGDDFVKYLMQPGTKEIAEIAELLRDGRLKAVIDSEYSLADSHKAMERQASGRATGKIVIKVP